jgi:hypothetical protein
MTTDTAISNAILDSIVAFHEAAHGHGRDALVFAVGALTALERLAIVLLGEEHETALMLAAARNERTGPGADVAEIAAQAIDNEAHS